MSLRITFRRIALREYQEAVKWYEKQRPGLGKAFITEVRWAVESVSESPYHFAVVHKEIRRIQVHGFPFSVFYRVAGPKLIVLAVFHGRRDPMQWRDRT